jgi:S1-C subfamily serine protease
VDRKEPGLSEKQDDGKEVVKAGEKEEPKFPEEVESSREEPGAGAHFNDVYGAFEDEIGDEDIEDKDIGDEEEEIPRRRPVWLRIVAFLTILAFLGLVAATSFPPYKGQLLELVLDSFKLQKNIDARLLQAVVQINVVSQKQNVPLAAEQKSGSGFNIDPRGVIVTNHHVIDGALNITVTFPDGKVYPARRCSSRPEYDLAVLTLEAEGLPTVPLNASGDLARGDQIRVVGNPLTLNNIVVEGEVEGYLLVGSKPDRVFSIDAPIYPGNSGSPVFDRNDQVVGVVFGILSGSENGREKTSGVAIPIREVLELSRVISNGQ